MGASVTGRSGFGFLADELHAALRAGARRTLNDLGMHWATVSLRFARRGLRCLFSARRVASVILARAGSGLGLIPGWPLMHAVPTVMVVRRAVGFTFAGGFGRIGFERIEAPIQGCRGIRSRSFAERGIRRMIFRGFECRLHAGTNSHGRDEQRRSSHGHTRIPSRLSSAGSAGLAMLPGGSLYQPGSSS